MTPSLYGKSLPYSSSVGGSHSTDDVEDITEDMELEQLHDDDADPISYEGFSTQGEVKGAECLDCNH